MPVRSKATPTDRLFGALANPTRRDILDLLLDGERGAGEIAARFEMSRPSVSEHLRALRDAGLVTERTDGRSVLYTPAPEPLLAVRDWLAPHERFWRERLTRMHRVLDALPDAPSRAPSDRPSNVPPDPPPNAPSGALDPPPNASSGPFIPSDRQPDAPLGTPRASPSEPLAHHDRRTGQGQNGDS